MERFTVIISHSHNGGTQYHEHRCEPEEVMGFMKEMKKHGVYMVRGIQYENGIPVHSEVIADNPILQDYCKYQEN